MGQGVRVEARRQRRLRGTDGTPEGAETGEFAPPEAGVPPRSAMGTFTSVKNLQDLARLLSPRHWRRCVAPLIATVTPTE